MGVGDNSTECPPTFSYVKKNQLISGLLMLFISLHQMTPLHVAAEGGCIKVVKCLLDHKADVNMKDRKGVNLFDHTK